MKAKPPSAPPRVWAEGHRSKVPAGEGRFEMKNRVGTGRKIALTAVATVMFVAGSVAFATWVVRAEEQGTPRPSSSSA